MIIITGMLMTFENYCYKQEIIRELTISCHQGCMALLVSNNCRSFWCEKYFEEKVTRNFEIQQVGQRVQNRFLRFSGMVDKA